MKSVTIQIRVNIPNNYQLNDSDEYFAIIE